MGGPSVLMVASQSRSRLSQPHVLAWSGRCVSANADAAASPRAVLLTTAIWSSMGLALVMSGTPSDALMRAQSVKATIWASGGTYVTSSRMSLRVPPAGVAAAGDWAAAPGGSSAAATVRSVMPMRWIRTLDTLLIAVSDRDRVTEACGTAGGAPGQGGMASGYHAADRGPAGHWRAGRAPEPGRAVRPGQLTVGTTAGGTVPQRYDAVIIGGGHNGLVSAAYLARAGLRTLVLERRHVLGGAAVRRRSSRASASASRATW